MDSPLWIYCIGFAAQVFFAARVMIQWYLSEKHHQVESPMLFWIFSLIGSLILLGYGWLRKDIAIVAGEVLSYYIYLWNLKAKGLFHTVPKGTALLLSLIPFAALMLMLKDASSFSTDFLRNTELPPALLAFGLAGQLVFKSRFIFQWFYSVRHRESTLPMIFWVISVVGSLMIIIYGLIRHDWVLVAGQVGIVASVRNIMIALAHTRDERVD